MNTQWLRKPIKAILLDITGVLYESGSTQAIAGSVEAIRRIRQSGLPFRLLTNETQDSVENLVAKLNGFGYDFNPNEVIAPMVVVKKHLARHQLRPYLLVHPKLLPDMASVPQEDPNCVVVGDASVYFTYEATNRAFQLLMRLKERLPEMSEDHRRSLLISMGRNKFYREHGELVMDLGAYTAALEYSTDLTALIIGKPSKDYFQAALDTFDPPVDPAQVIMVGDDIVGDVGGAQKCGMRGVLVRTGKYQAKDETHPEVKPDAIVDNLSAAIEQIIATRQSSQ